MSAHVAESVQADRYVAVLCGVEISRVDYYIDSGDHILESIEFDVVAGGDTFDEAFERFHRRLVDYALMLGELETDELAENEREAARLLLPRLMKGYEAVEQQLAGSSASRRPARRIVSAFRALRGKTESSAWRALSRPQNSHVPLHA